LSINGIESSKELEKPGHLQPNIFMTLSIQSSALYANLCLLSYISLRDLYGKLKDWAMGSVEFYSHFKQVCNIRLYL